MGGWSSGVSRRFLAALACAFVVASVLAVGAAAVERIGGATTIQTNPCATKGCVPDIHGRVTSPVDACERRNVVVRSVREELGYRAADQTDSTGRWLTTDVPTERMRVYALVKRKQLSGDRVCRRIETSAVVWVPAG